MALIRGYSPLKTSENLWFSDVPRGYRKKSVAWNRVNETFTSCFSWNQCSQLFCGTHRKDLIFILEALLSALISLIVDENDKCMDICNDDCERSPVNCEDIKTCTKRYSSCGENTSFFKICMHIRSVRVIPQKLLRSRDFIIISKSIKVLVTSLFRTYCVLLFDETHEFYGINMLFSPRVIMNFVLHFPFRFFVLQVLLSFAWIFENNMTCTHFSKFSQLTPKSTWQVDLSFYLKNFSTLCGSY